MLKLTIFLVGSLRLSLSANVQLNIWGSFSLLFSMFIRLFPFLNDINQMFICCFGQLFWTIQKIY